MIKSRGQETGPDLVLGVILKFTVRHDGSVSIILKKGERSFYMRAPEKFFVNEFEIVDGQIVSFEQRKLK